MQRPNTILASVIPSPGIRRGRRRVAIGCLALGVLCCATLAPLAAAEKLPTKDITFDDVKLDLKKGAPFERTALTSAVKKLDGTPVRINGYILPGYQQSGLKQFVLVRDNMECCFGPGAALYDCIVVEMADGAATEFTIRPVSVTGTFSVREVPGLDGNTLAIYHLDGTAVK